MHGKVKVTNKFPLYSKMKEEFPGIKPKIFPMRCLNMDFEKDIKAAEE